MIRLLQLLIFGHIHKWEARKTIDVSHKGSFIGERVFLVCKNCGDHKFTDLF